MINAQGEMNVVQIVRQVITTSGANGSACFVHTISPIAINVWPLLPHSVIFLPFEPDTKERPARKRHQICSGMEPIFV